MFDYIWGRIKSLVGASSVGRAEARYWHRRVYGGLVCPSPLSPTNWTRSDHVDRNFRLISLLSFPTISAPQQATKPTGSSTIIAPSTNSP